MTEAKPGNQRWGDLRNRALSGGVMVAVGAAEIWLGGLSFAVLVILLSAVMVWELARMTAPGSGSAALSLALIAGLSQAGALGFDHPLAASLLMVPALALALTPRNERQVATLYAIGIMVTGYGLVHLRAEGTVGIIWLLSVVVVSDIAGYFVGRMVGGPKFWPAISPKKTWSGTVAGWVGAILVSLIFMALGYAPSLVLLLAPVVSLAGQMGDIAESWLKRRAGIKDSSNLIPGHGGFLDRFDALIGAVVLIMLLGLVASLPIPVSIGG
jgi:phosphatidate cytidylyltransferase